MSQGRGYRRREEEKQIPWVPRTKLGTMVAEGKITSLEEIFQQGWKIREPEMVKKLVPDLSSEVVYVGIVQKQTDAGELTRFGAVVAVGNGNGWFGVGKGKAAQMKSAIDKATNDALLNIIRGRPPPALRHPLNLVHQLHSVLGGGREHRDYRHPEAPLPVHHPSKRPHSMTR